MMVIGIDAHKRSHTAVRIDEKGSLLATKTKCDLAVRIFVGADGSWSVSRTSRWPRAFTQAYRGVYANVD